MDIYKRVENLENQLNGILKKIENNKFYQDADDNAEKIRISDTENGVSENDSAIMDIAELSDENGTAIEELADMLDDLEERVTSLESKEE